MKEKNILQFLQDLPAHAGEGVGFLTSILTPQDNPTPTANPTSTDDEASPPADATPTDDAISETEEDVEMETGTGIGDLPGDFIQGLRNSMTLLEGYRSGRRVPQEGWNEMFGLLFRIAGDMASGTISTDTADALLRAVFFHREVELARREGEVSGRNAKIEEHLMTTRKTAGDLPVMPGSFSPAQQQKKSQTIFDLAGQAR